MPRQAEKAASRAAARAVGKTSNTADLEKKIASDSKAAGKDGQENVKRNRKKTI